MANASLSGFHPLLRNSEEGLRSPLKVDAVNAGLPSDAMHSFERVRHLPVAMIMYDCRADDSLPSHTARVRPGDVLHVIQL